MGPPDSHNNTNHEANTTQNLTGGAFGAGLVLVLLPTIALFYIFEEADKLPSVGLPILAIFGIMILFGSVSLVSTLFARLKLSDKSQALALPEGSIRAAIALALIVLFAIISIMLYQSSSNPQVIKITGVSEAVLPSMIQNPANQVAAVVPENCTTDTDPTTEACADKHFSVHVRLAPSQESTDLAKQLLILIGTLMTSVTSFYFAQRASEKKSQEPPPEPAKQLQDSVGKVSTDEELSPPQGGAT